MLRRIITELLVPPACLACRAPGADLCGDCRRALTWLAPPVCPRCGLPQPCGTRCPAAGAAFARAWSAVAYRGPARDLVLALKARRRFAAADVMAAQMAAAAPAGVLAAATLVPVPGHPHRARARGFDQAERIAVALSRRTGAPLRRCLRRSGAGGRQVGADRAGRLAGGGVDVRARGRSPARAVLVDDVHTTGATLQACAAALLRGGSEWVGAVTYARTLPTGCSHDADNCPGGG